MLELNEIHNPFPGIRPFEMDETNLFFGRDGQSDELLKRMQRTRLLAVVGTSGSGKSSLIRAGLLPALYGGLMGDAGSSWRIAIQRPGGDPIGNLAMALADPLVFGSENNSEIQTALIETTLRRSSIGLVDVAREARMAGHENLLVVVDQFEELFRFKQLQTSDDATTFVKLLLEASAQRDIPIYVIITMRSDFLGDCSQFTGLPEAINNGQYLIPRMSRDERQSAIVGPIAVGQGEISAPLVSRLLNDVGDNPDQLPILQHALMRTWEHWSAHRLNGNPIALEDYTAIGTMSEALSRHADEAFNELPDERSRMIAEKLFKRLTEKGTDNREIRRPTRLDELCAVCGASEDDLIAIIDVFRREGRSFLMPPAGTRLNSETVIDISHESLIRNWIRLQKWVDEEAQSSRIYRRLAEAAVLHREGSEGLLQDPGLQITLDWFEKNNPNGAWAQRYHSEFAEAKKYLEESCAAREAAELERERQRNMELERERREREQAERFAAGQAKAARRLRRYLVAMVALAVLAFGAAAVAAAALYKSRQNLITAQKARAQAEFATDRANESLKSEAAAKAIAEEATKAAKADRQEAIDQKAIADERAAEADAARKDAVDSAAAAERERKTAEKEATKNLKAKKANDYFREAALYVQRGKYQDAKDFFSNAIEEYQDPDVTNDEGVADATVEIGNLALAVARQSFSYYQDFRRGNVMGNLNMAIGKYDQAAKIYAGPTVNALDKAAATNFSLAMSLLPFANGTIPRAPAAASTAGWNGSEGEIPSFSIAPQSGGPLAFDDSVRDPITKLKNATLNHLQTARSQYQQVFEGHKNNAGDWRTAAAREGARKATYQLGDFFLKLANEESTNRAYKNDTDRQKAVDLECQRAAFYFEDLLSTFETDDIQRGRLLIWLAGLHLALAHGENAAAEEQKAQAYLNRIAEAFVKAGWSDRTADALSMAGTTLSTNGQFAEAGELFRRAKVAYQKEKSLAQQAEMAFNIAQLLQKQNRVDAALDEYLEALANYQNAHEQKSFMPPFRLLEIARFFKTIGGEVSFGKALQALDLAVDCGEQCKFYRSELAAAYSERGSILSLQNKPREALRAYEQAASFYEAVSKDTDLSDAAREQVASELERVKTIVKALQTILTNPSKK